MDKGTDEDLTSEPPDPDKTSPKKAGLKQSLPFFMIEGQIKKLHFVDCGRRARNAEVEAGDGPRSGMRSKEIQLDHIILATWMPDQVRHDKGEDQRTLGSDF